MARRSPPSAFIKSQDEYTLDRALQTWVTLRDPNITRLYGLCLNAQFGEYGALVPPTTLVGLFDWTVFLSTRYLSLILPRQFSEVEQGMDYPHAFSPAIVHSDSKPFAYLQRPSSGYNCIPKVLHDICHDIPPAIRPARAEEHPGHLVLWNLLETCWTSEPNDRLTSRDIFGHLSSAGNAIIEALEDVYVP
ncbi:hypothetical protein FRC19_011667 [Serendipita sp. 401]|nr:hypothetical protein FRC19_011667 [Serendipita sp. 401]